MSSKIKEAPELVIEQWPKKKKFELGFIIRSVATRRTAGLLKVWAK